MAPAAFRHHRKRGGESPPSSSSSLTFSLDGRRVSPMVLGLHGMGGARAPPRLDLSLYFCILFSFPSSFLKFPEIRNSNLAEIWTPFYPDISFLAAKEGNQPPYGVATRAQGAPPASWPPRVSSRVDSSSQKSFIFQKNLRQFLSRLDSV